MDIEQFKYELSTQDFGNDMDDVKPKRPWFNFILQEARAKTRQFERK